MSNEYVIVNTNKKDETVWSTIASTYTPSKGEVCIMVPTKSSFDIGVNGDQQAIEEALESAGIGIKIGDGETVFKELPLLTDVSMIHPDWDETDTSSPNYIWHKPLMNDDMFILSDIQSLVINSDYLQELVQYKDPDKIKQFHYTDYYYLCDLEPASTFIHPSDLLIREDNNWGYYEIKYQDNGQEITNPKYFYKNNIVKRDNSYYIEKSDENYRSEINAMIYSIIDSIVKSNNYYLMSFSSALSSYFIKNEDNQYILPKEIEQKLYYSYNDKLYAYEYPIIDTTNLTEEERKTLEKFQEAIQNKLIQLSEHILDYLVLHKGNILFNDIKTILTNLATPSFDNSQNLEGESTNLKLDIKTIQRFASAINTELNRYENLNILQNRFIVNNGQYYDINNDLVIDIDDYKLYMRCSSLDLINDNIGGSFTTEPKLYEASEADPLSKIEIPFDASKGTFNVRITNAGENKVIKKQISNTYTNTITLDDSEVASIKEFNQSFAYVNSPDKEYHLYYDNLTETNLLEEERMPDFLSANSNNIEVFYKLDNYSISTIDGNLVRDTADSNKYQFSFSLGDFPKEHWNYSTLSVTYLDGEYERTQIFSMSGSGEFDAGLFSITEKTSEDGRQQIGFLEVISSAYNKNDNNPYLSLIFDNFKYAILDTKYPEDYNYLSSVNILNNQEILEEKIVKISNYDKSTNSLIFTNSQDQKETLSCLDTCNIQDFLSNNSSENDYYLLNLISIYKNNLQTEKKSYVSRINKLGSINTENYYKIVNFNSNGFILFNNERYYYSSYINFMSQLNELESNKTYEMNYYTDSDNKNKKYFQSFIEFDGTEEKNKIILTLEDIEIEKIYRSVSLLSSSQEVNEYFYLHTIEGLTKNLYFTFEIEEDIVTPNEENASTNEENASINGNGIIQNINKNYIKDKFNTYYYFDNNSTIYYYQMKKNNEFENNDLIIVKEENSKYVPINDDFANSIVVKYDATIEFNDGDYFVISEKQPENNYGYIFSFQDGENYINNIPINENDKTYSRNFNIYFLYDETVIRNDDNNTLIINENEYYYNSIESIKSLKINNLISYDYKINEKGKKQLNDIILYHNYKETSLGTYVKFLEPFNRNVRILYNNKNTKFKLFYAPKIYEFSGRDLNSIAIPESALISQLNLNKYLAIVKKLFAPGDIKKDEISHLNYVLTDMGIMNTLSEFALPEVAESIKKGQSVFKDKKLQLENLQFRYTINDDLIDYDFLIYDENNQTYKINQSLLLDSNDKELPDTYKESWINAIAKLICPQDQYVYKLSYNLTNENRLETFYLVYYSDSIYGTGKFNDPAAGTNGGAYYYTIENNTIKLNIYLKAGTEVTIDFGYNLIDSDIKDYTIVNNQIRLVKPITQPVYITFIRNKDSMDNKFSIAFYYRRRALRPDLVDDLMADWGQNNPAKGGYIAGRPIYQGDDKEIYLDTGNGTYSNGRTDYYSFFEQFITEVSSKFNDTLDIAELKSRLDEFAAWLSQYQQFMQDCYAYKYSFDDTEKTRPNERIYPFQDRGIINALNQVAKELHGLKDAIANKTEIAIEPQIGNNGPAPNTADDKYYKLWINTHASCGNGVMYYYHPSQKKWIPMSALWTDGGNSILPIDISDEDKGAVNTSSSTNDTPIY